MERRKGDFPSMDNYYNSTNWEKIKNIDFLTNKNSNLNNLNYSNGEQSNFAPINELFDSLTGENNIIQHTGNVQKFISGGVTQNVNIDNYIIDNDKDIHELFCFSSLDEGPLKKNLQ